MPLRSFSRQSRTLGDIRDDNLIKTIQDVGKQVASLEKEKKLALLNRKLAELEAEMAARFPTNVGFVNEKTLEESHICQIINQKLKLTMPFVKPYSSLNYAQYQTFVRLSEHVFRSKPTTYRKEVDKVLYLISALEGTLFTAWYRYKEKFGWLDMGLDAFKTFLLDDFFPPEICLRDICWKCSHVVPTREWISALFLISYISALFFVQCISCLIYSACHLFCVPFLLHLILFDTLSVSCLSSDCASTLRPLRPCLCIRIVSHIMSRLKPPLAISYAYQGFR